MCQSYVEILCASHRATKSRRDGIVMKSAALKSLVQFQNSGYLTALNQQKQATNSCKIQSVERDIPTMHDTVLTEK